MPAGLIERYRDRLPLEAGDPVVTLNEGSTPLVEAPVISERVGARVLLKLEGANPTGSFKDRGMTVAVSRAAGAGAEAVICASTGNTAASAAAYAARAGLRGAVIVPEGKIAIGKLAQALMHGARVIALRGNFDQALRDRPQARRDAPGRARQLGQPLSDRGPEDGRVRGRRGARRGARRARDPGRQRRQRHRLAAGLHRVRRRADPLRLPGGRRGAAGPRRRRSRSPRRSPPRSGSGTRRAGRRRWPRSPARAAGSRRSPTIRSSTPTGCSPRARASSASRPRRPRSPGSSPTACRSPRASAAPETVVCVLTGHGLKDPDTALGKAPAVIGCEPDLAAVERAVFD